MTFTIRRSTGSAADYEAMVRVIDIVGLDPPKSAAELQEADATRRAGGFVAERLVAEVEAAVVGYAAYGHLETAAAGDVFIVGLRVAPSSERRGIGRALHEAVLDDASRHQIRQVISFVDERSERGIGFATAAGYEEVGREWSSTVNPQRFDPAPFATVSSRVREQGIRFTTVADLRERVPDWFERLHRLYTTLEADIPFLLEERPLSAETFRADAIDSSSAMLDAFLIALDGDDWIGLTELRRIERRSTWLLQELTGVVQSHRRRGIATALKVAGLEHAKALGCERIQTWNDARNTGMLAVNDRLGYERSHAIRVCLLSLDA